MTVEPTTAGSDLHERHANLKRDPRFFRKHADGAHGTDDGYDLPKESPDLGRLVAEMMLECVGAASMRLVPIGERASALQAVPKRTLAHRPTRLGGRAVRPPL